MQAVILAAGKGSRMHPLTLTRPKPLVEVAGEPLLSHIIGSLPKSIDEVILVVGYLGQNIIDSIGDTHKGRRMQYVWQTETRGTAHALEQARELLHGSFLLLYGDDLIDTESIERALAHPACLLSYEHPEPKNFGVILLNPDGTAGGIIEKPENPPSNLVCAAGLVLNTDIFDHYGESPDGREFYLTEVVDRYAKENTVHVETVSFWCPVNRPEDIARAEAALAVHLTTPVESSTSLA